MSELADAIRGRVLTQDCWSVAHRRLTGADAVERIDAHAEQAHTIADGARRALRR